ncbi:hypothetical protein SY83_17170 [Paenibacillus swuensis]|uniref:Exosporium protein C n=1 Tax=Paenibacillus swuensis TaxID=1178515 RepID=A0A172TL73_9BACL|nr:hypothetical protein [Paenibacillus swuensis]ANE47726.1 hypothetical protein SY83_17170 [Paenibacillus swuensis]
MAIQFLDERISVQNDTSSGTLVLPTPAPLLLGDIGLQVLAAIPTGNAADVRVALNGIVGLSTDIGVIDTVTLTVERNSTGEAGTGVTVLTEIFVTTGIAAFPPLSVSAGDFPPESDVLNGEIRYSLFIVVEGEGSLILTGPVVFNGSASAGTTG